MFTAIAPVRVLDTRPGGHAIGGFTPRQVQIAGVATIPANAVAVSGNITVINPTTSYAAYIGPQAVKVPGTSSVNFTAGQTVGNGFVVGLSNGQVYITFMGKGKGDFCVDITGYWTA
jgi:hypothetical protein